jgi:hypothetical protein
MQARHVRLSLLLAGLALALLSGCGKKNPTAANGLSTPGTDQAAVSGVVAATSSLVDDGLMESADQALFSATTPSGALSAVRPLHYWRRITNIRRSFSFAFSDTDTTGRPTRAVVTVHKELSGTFNLIFDATPNDTMLFDTVGVVHKPLNDLWVRQILLRRVHRMPDGDMVLGSGPEDGDDHNGGGDGHHGHHRDEWKVAGISGVDVRSFDPSASTEGSPAFGATKIQSLRIQATALDTTINDPLQFILLHRIHIFGPSEDVTLTVTTSSSTDVLVLVRTGLRRRFHNNGDKTYTLTWHTSPEDGLHHFGVNALSNGTLFDDQAPYDSDAWIFPYAISPCAMADYLP